MKVFLLAALLGTITEIVVGQRKPAMRATGFEKIHFLAVVEGDGSITDVHDNLERLTCFRLAHSPTQADATLHVEMLTGPPPGAGDTWKLGESVLLYKGYLKDRNGKIIWRGKAQTGPLDLPIHAETHLLLIFRDAGCPGTPRPK